MRYTRHGARFGSRRRASSAAPPRAVAVALAGLVLLGACSGDEPDGAPPARLVVTSEAALAPAVERLALLGDVHGELEVRVFAQLPERIRTLHVREGSAVEEGDPIATLEADLSMSDEAQAGAALTAAEAARDRLQGDEERVAELVRQRAAASSQLDALRAQVRSADAQVAQLRAARRAAGARRARTVVRAPATGIVALLAVQEGDMSAPQLPLCTVVRMDRVQVIVRAVEADYVRLREGMVAEVMPPALPEVRRAGTVTRVSPVIDRLTRTATVEIDVDNADHVLRPGMVAQVGIELARRDGVLMVPARAVLMTTRTERESVATVFVPERAVARARSVRIGGRFGDAIEILDGLRAGDAVIVEGQHLLRDGSAIRTEAGVAARAQAP